MNFRSILPNVFLVLIGFAIAYPVAVFSLRAWDQPIRGHLHNSYSSTKR